MNNEVLKDIIKQYKKDFDTVNSEEIYKWKAVKCFQDNWDIDAPDFIDMIKKSLNKSCNLLAAHSFFPKAMILFWAEKDPEAVRSMFRKLFDESISLDERIDNFMNESERLRIKYYEGNAKMTYQNLNAISVYLFFCYPNKYYLFKTRKFKGFAEKVGFEHVPKSGKIEGVQCYIDMCNEVLEVVKQDPEVLEMSKNRIKEDCYPDEAYHILVEDIVFFGSNLEKRTSDWRPRLEDYSPEISKEKWLELLSNSSIFTIDSLKIMKRILDFGGAATCVQLSKKYGESNNFYNTGSAYLAKRVWQETHCPLFDKDSFDSKWWPILYVGKRADKFVPGSFIWKLRDELKEALQEIDMSKIPLYDEVIDDNSIEGEKHYWWLNANPKIWSFNSIRVGEEVGYTLLNDNGNKRKIYKNFLDAKANDLVIGYESTPVKQVVALCKISRENDGEQLYFKKLESLSNPIDYSTLHEITELQSMEYFSNPMGSLFKLTKEEYEAILDNVREQNPVKKNEDVEVYTKEDFLSQVYMDEARYDSLIGLLNHKKNIILQGAPGVGKTFAAKRLAYSIIGKKDESKIEFVQFHQNYSYEDFIMGYKP